MKFRNPTNNYIEEANSPVLCTLLFGCFYFAVKGVWTHAVAALFLAIVTYGLSWLIYPWFASQIMRSHYLRKGWIEETNAAAPPPQPRQGSYERLATSDWSQPTQPKPNHPDHLLKAIIVIVAILGIAVALRQIGDVKPTAPNSTPQEVQRSTLVEPAQTRNVHPRSPQCESYLYHNRFDVRTNLTREQIRQELRANDCHVIDE